MLCLARPRWVAGGSVQPGHRISPLARGLVQGLAGQNLTLRIQRYCISRNICHVQRNQNPLQPALGGLLRAEQDPRRTAARAPERGEEPEILPRMVQQ